MTSVLQQFFHAGRDRTDSVSTDGSNAIGGLLNRVHHIFAWPMAMLISTSAPEYGPTAGAEFRRVWAERKVNNINKNFADGLTLAAAYNPFFRKWLIISGERIHKDFKFWLGWNLFTTTFTVATNIWFIRRTGGWAAKVWPVKS